MGVSETLRRIYSDDRRAFLEIGLDADTGTCIELRTIGEESIKWFGEIRLTLDDDMAKALSDALAAAIDEKRSK